MTEPSVTASSLSWLTVAESLKRGALPLRAHPVAIAGIGAAFAAVAVGGCLLPWLNFPFLLFGLAPWLGGIPSAALDLLDEQRPEPRWLIRGFRHYERYLGLCWLTYLISALAAMPWLIALWLGRQLPADGSMAALLPWFGLAATTGLWSLLLLPHLFAPFALAEAASGSLPPATGDVAPGSPSGLERALELSRRLCSPSLRRPLLHASAMFFLAVSGLALFGLGALWTVPWALLSSAAQYRHLRRQLHNGDAAPLAAG
ncbi:MAG: hypothetical protein AAGD01_05610 [Acidobacteriota bacterium]